MTNVKFCVNIYRLYVMRKKFRIKNNEYSEKYPRGRMGSPAKGVVCDKRSEGSNPSFSAKKPQKAPIFY